MPHTSADADRRERATIRQMTQPQGEGAAAVLVRWTLGALFIDEFFVNLHHRNYTQAGYTRLINHYIRSAHSPAVWHSAEHFVIDHAQAFAIAQAVGELALGFALAAGLLRPVAGLVAGAWLVTLWLSELGLGWVWEFPPIIVGSIAVALANLSWFRRAGWRERVLGPRVGRPLVTAPAALVAGLILTAFVLAHRDPTVEVWRAGAVFTAALLVSALFDATVRIRVDDAFDA